jgi:hypothetical protein
VLLECDTPLLKTASSLLTQDKIKVRTEHPPNSTTIVQPPFDEGLGDACLCHYTWGALYHEGLPSKGGKQVGCHSRRHLCHCQSSIE